jgi:hypothetical protein
VSILLGQQCWRGESPGKIKRLLSVGARGVDVVVACGRVVRLGGTWRAVVK